MKTEGLTHRANTPATGGRETGVRTGRWLADLERALWDAGDPHRAAQRLPSRAVPDERTSVRDPGLEARPQAHGDPAAATSAAVPTAGAVSAAAPHEAANNAVTAPVISTPLSVQMADPGRTATDGKPGASAIEARTFAQVSRQAVPVGASDSPRPAPMDPLPQGGVRRAAAALTADLPDAPQPASAQSSAPPQYAARVLQVSGDGDLRVNLRDATLDAASELSVAHSLFGEMRAAGLSVRRLYVNGKLFECDLEGSPAGPFPTLFPSINKE